MKRIKNEVFLKKIKIKDLRFGDSVYTDDFDYGLVISRCKTMFHHHLYIQIRFCYVHMIDGYVTYTKTYIAEETEESLFKIMIKSSEVV